MPDNAGILSFVSAIAGFIFGAVALYLLAKQRFVKGGSDGNIEVEIPVFGRIKSNYPALVVVFVGALLIIYPQAHPPEGPKVCPDQPPPPPVAQVTVKGKLLVKKEAHVGAMVGVVAGAL